MTTYAKDPDATLDYAVDWSAWLDGDDTITTSAWIVDDGITQNTIDHDDTTATIWVTGGTVGQTYELTNRITTAAGRIDDRTIKITVRNR